MLRLMGLPRRPVFQHGIEDGQQFPHARDERDFLGFAGGAEPLIETPNHGIEAGRHDRSHVECHPHLGTPTPHRASASQGPAIPIQRGHADEGGDLFVRQRTQFRQIGQQGRGQDRTDARHAP